MNIVLWVLQILLAVHTLIGAVWKLSNSEQSVPSLEAIPRDIWKTLSGVEVLLAIGLVLPLVAASAAIAAPIAALGVAAEMLLFCVVHLRSGASKHAEMGYWLVVAGLCAFVAVGRVALAPL